MSFHGDLRRHSGVVIYVHIRPFTSVDVAIDVDRHHHLRHFTSIYVHLLHFTSLYVNSEAASNPILVNLVTREGRSRGGFPLHDGQNQSTTHNPEIDDLLVKKYLTSFFEVSVHKIGTILKSNVLTLQSASI